MWAFCPELYIVKGRSQRNLSIDQKLGEIACVEAASLDTERKVGRCTREIRGYDSTAYKNQRVSAICQGSEIQKLGCTLGESQGTSYEDPKLLSMQHHRKQSRRFHGKGLGKASKRSLG